jgi:N-acetylmuramoyl-L-alanine amidase
MTTVVISSGHSKYVRGASGVLDEVNEARRVVEHIADELIDLGVEVITFHDDISQTQSENLETITSFHNAQTRDLDVSIHFNAYVETMKPMGTECLYVSQTSLAQQVSSAIASCGFVNRGAKKRTDLYFLNNTEMPAILIEVCFVDSHTDAEVYNANFDKICEYIAVVLSGDESIAPAPPDIGIQVGLRGKVSWFGGPNDKGVASDEDLAFIYEVDQAPHLFLPYQPPNTTGLARRLDPHAHYIACRWDYDSTPREQLLEDVALVRSLKTGRALTAYPSDWGPHVDTGRVADISPGLMEALGIQTDDEIEVIFPFKHNGEV